MRASIAAPFLLFVIPFLCSTATGGDTLTPTRPLTYGETLISAGGIFALGFFTPANSTNHYVGIWYNKISIQTVVWVANRQTPIADHAGNLSITADGDLIIFDSNSTLIWSSNSSGLGLTGAVAQILDDGNFVVREASSNSNDAAAVAWQIFDHPTDTILPDMKVGENLKSGLKIEYQSWTSESDPAPGNYILALDLHGDPQIFFSSRTSQIWRSGPWNGVRFSGIPDMNTHSSLAIYLTDVNPNEVFYSFKVRNSSVISRLKVDESGVLQRLVWLESTKMWATYWVLPKDSCDKVSTCGPFALCDSNDIDDSAICHCMQGFQPKSPDNWALREWSDGCVRKTKLNCTNGTDGFATVSDVKLPDTSNSTVDMSLSLEQCKALCLKNCSCTGYATANISDGSGCLLWTTNLTDVRQYSANGQDFYLRLAAADLESSDNSHKRNIVLIVVGSVVGALLLALLVCCAWKRKEKNRKKKEVSSSSMVDTFSFPKEPIDGREGVEEFDLPLYDLSIMEAATNNFSEVNKLGQGGFGPVYKGQLREGEEIAVKRLSKTSVQGIDEFKNEVMLIAKLQHRNLVRLLGCCIQGEERILIYEYMPNKSLDILLFDKSKGPPLDWHTRYNIIFGIARGLLYLHQDSRFRIIHRDLKASNILLDKDMNPKISDFGMARIFGENETEVNTIRVVGTYGYISPEYAMEGIFSVKSDVFSFGVLVLEIISGKRNRGVYYSNSNSKRQENLLGHAWSLWKEGNGMQLLDESMRSAFPLDEALKCIRLGLLCVQEHPEDRPTMSSVVVMLGGKNSSLPNPRQPGFVATRGPSESNSSSIKQDAMSITTLEGR
ncbi:receptor-like serine/threonine-protein kinase SD1-8 isoform X1 [Typha latifolia]|uniref:receptor-like serine/threonine-protein kinase SD1-8 isoform X1 n=2 Tax=Typha latifolia TaxID=4733 RepID=UPI003C2C6CCA